ncbi:PadR family transcriptional regulator [Nitrobacter sp. NHB1]|uniref:PadR family transcriptional regulator n=1 Tax=Nitrobacter sp. NHB1 TaxID=3119830 RepID=UPI003000EE5D
MAEGDLRLVALSLISETPRHGYEVIQTIEKMTSDWFLPNPNVIHPMLASLVDERCLTASADPPRLFTITDEGRAYLELNCDRADAVVGRLKALGERVARWRNALGMAERLKDADADATEGLLDVLARASMQRK